MSVVTYLSKGRETKDPFLTLIKKKLYAAEKKQSFCTYQCRQMIQQPDNDDAISTKQNYLMYPST